MKSLILGLAVFLAIAFLASPQAQAQGTILEEVIGSRTQHSKVFEDRLNPGTFQVTSSIAPLHYESILGSGVFDREIDFRPLRTVNPDFDGWTVQEAGWWYRLGNLTAHGSDGWVGFGGRSGQAFLDFRLSILGYLHYPTRAVEILSDTPDYDRSRLTQNALSIPMGNGEMFPGASALWADVFTTPGGGNLSLEWLAGGQGLKENVIINQEAVAWIRANRPPSTPPAETFFGMVFELDLSAIPFLVKEGETVNPNSDFDDSDGVGLELRDSRGRFLGLLPIEEVESRDPTGEALDSLTLRKRIWKPAGSDTHRLLIGARVSDLNNLPAGDLVFDPTINAQVGAGADDCDTEANNPGLSCTKSFGDVPGNDPGEGDVGNTSFLFRGIAIPQGSVITSANFSPFLDVDGDDGLGFRSQIFLEADDNATAPTSEANYDAKNTTANFTDWNDVVGSVAFETSPDIGPAVQEVINRTGWVNGSNLQILWKYVFGQGVGFNVETRFFEDSPARGAMLDIDFVPAGPPPPPGNGPLFPSVAGDFNAFLLQVILVGGLLVPLLLWTGRRTKNGAPEILAGLALVLFAFRVGQFLGDFALALLFIAVGLLIAVYGVFLWRGKP